MARVIKFAKGVRNHWKKSTFAACVLAYAGSWLNEKHEINKLMRVYCEQAQKYGQREILVSESPRKISIILNPAANKRKAVDEFEKYCAPILNLAGIIVDVIQTESEGHAKELVQELGGTDAIVVGGGDGTISEVLTGLLRRTGENNGKHIPIGVLPLGKTNSVTSALFPGGEHLAKVKSMADASLAIIEERTKPLDVMKIEILEERDEDIKKPVYALSGMEWGVYRDASSKKDKYWYYGPLKKYATYVFNGYKDDLSWNCDAIINFSAPCDGCSNCHVNKNLQVNKKWYHAIFSSPKNQVQDASKVINDRCNIFDSKEISTSDLNLFTSNTLANSTDGPPKLHLELGPSNLDYIDFVSEGWRTERGQRRRVLETIEARQIEIRPNVVSTSEEEKDQLWFSIDKEDFEVRSIKVTLLPKLINVFCKKESL